MTMRNTIRKPAVAGSFYSADSDRLMADVNGYLAGATGEAVSVLGAISPHAGYYYSGHVAGAVFGSLEVPDKVILIGPNHRGQGAMCALDDSGGWRFPFGVVPVDRELSFAIANECPSIEFDSTAHRAEHSLEVICPFLYARNPDISIAPLALYAHDKAVLDEIAAGVAKAAKESGALIVASTDMTHYLPDSEVREIDHGSIELVQTLDSSALLDKVREDQSLCGISSVTVALTACKKIGAHEAKLIKYATSGDIEGKKESVVGYAGFTICE